MAMIMYAWAPAAPDSWYEEIDEDNGTITRTYIGKVYEFTDTSYYDFQAQNPGFCVSNIDPRIPSVRPLSPPNPLPWMCHATRGTYFGDVFDISDKD